MKRPYNTGIKCLRKKMEHHVFQAIHFRFHRKKHYAIFIKNNAI